MLNKDEIILECINIMNETGKPRAEALRQALDTHYENESSALEMMTRYDVGYDEAMEISKTMTDDEQNTQINRIMEKYDIAYEEACEIFNEL